MATEAATQLDEAALLPAARAGDDGASERLFSPHRKAPRVHCYRSDLDGIVELLAGDAVLTMPPEPMHVVGTKAIADLFRTVPAAGELARVRLEPARSNARPALAAYLEDDSGAFHAYGIMVFAIAGEAIAGITGFAGYPELGLAPTLGG